MKNRALYYGSSMTKKSRGISHIHLPSHMWKIRMHYQDISSRVSTKIDTKNQSDENITGIFLYSGIGTNTKALERKKWKGYLIWNNNYYLKSVFEKRT